MADIQISSQAALLSALASARGGETFVLAAGNYGDLSIYAKAFASNVTIKSASTTNPAHFDTVLVNSSSNITFAGLDIGRALSSSEPNYTPMSRVNSSQNITFDGVKIHGSLDGDASNDGLGLSINYSTGVTVKNSEFTQNGNGMIFDHSLNILVQNNNMHGMRSDAMDFSSSSQVRIDGNTYRDFQPATGDHPDAIQFWNLSSTSSVHDIIITNNVVLAGDSRGPQGIFMADNGGYAYQNVLIQNNLIFTGGQYNGIMVSGANGVQILGNTVTSPGNDSLMAWIRLDAVTSGLVQDNVTDKIVNEGGTVATLLHNLSLNGDSAAQGLIPNLLKGLNTTVSDLLTANYGYHPVTSGNTANTVYQGVGALLGSQLRDVFVANHISPSGANVTTDLDRMAPTYAMSDPTSADLDSLLSSAGLSSGTAGSQSSTVSANPYNNVGPDLSHSLASATLALHLHAIA